MAYQLNRTDGTLLVDLVDGTIDVDSTDLTLVGRNYSGFGEFINENFIKLLENFSGSSNPNFPLRGQLWHDTNEGRLKIFDGEQWIPAAAPFVQNTRPNNLNLGDFWIDDYRNQLYFYDGSDLTLAGPIYSTVQGKSGFEVQSIKDNTGRSKTVVLLYVAGTITAVIVNEQFDLPQGVNVGGLTGTLRKGINIVEGEDFQLYGSVENARNLLNAQGEQLNPTQFLPADRNGVTTGSLGIQNNDGLLLGIADNLELSVKKDQVVDQVQIKAKIANQDLLIGATDAAGEYTAMFWNAQNRYLGVGTASPNSTVDVAGDVTIRGDLLVQGQNTYLNVTTLRSQDLNLELGLLDDSTEGDDVAVDGGGIIVRSSQGSKDWTWENSTKSWTSNQHVNLTGTSSLKFNGVEVLTGTELKGVTVANNLNTIGTLNDLTIDNIELDGQRITTGATYNLQIDSQGGAVTLITPQKISNVSDPTTAQDVATKNYVDTEIISRDMYLSLDITGLTTLQVADVLRDIAPIFDPNSGIRRIADGVLMRIHAVSQAGATVTGITFQSANPADPGYVDKTFAQVAAHPNYLASESVVQDVNISDAEGSIQSTVTRSTLFFEVTPGGGTSD